MLVAAVRERERERERERVHDAAIVEFLILPLILSSSSPIIPLMWKISKHTRTITSKEE